jgi:uncharacterized protein (DUF924 family)
VSASAASADVRAVLDYWFGAPGSPESGTLREFWFRKSAATDREIARRFGALVEQALRGDLDGWADSPDGALARILVLDQFPRNVYRDSPRAYAGDAQALRAAIAMVDAGDDEALPPAQRAFVYLPYEHAESLAMQDEAVRLFSRLAAEAPALSEMLDYAHRHRAVVQEFGRFPHRNAILGRPSTPAEINFLRRPGSGF